MIIDIFHRIFSELNNPPLLEKIFPCVATFETDTPDYPYLVYQRTGADVIYTKDAFSGEIVHHYSISIYSPDYSQTLALAKNVIDRMMNSISYWQMDDYRIGAVLLTDISEDFVEGIYVQNLQFDITTKEYLQQ